MCFKTSSQIPTSQALYEIAFAPEMLPHRIEKERKAHQSIEVGMDQSTIVNIVIYYGQSI